MPLNASTSCTASLNLSTHRNCSTKDNNANFLGKFCDINVTVVTNSTMFSIKIIINNNTNNNQNKIY